MRQDLLDEFDLIQSKDFDSLKAKNLIYKLECRIDAFSMAADLLKYSRDRIENEAREMATFRDLLKEKLK